MLYALPTDPEQVISLGPTTDRILDAFGFISPAIEFMYATFIKAHQEENPRTFFVSELTKNDMTVLEAALIWDSISVIPDTSVEYRERYAFK